ASSFLEAFRRHLFEIGRDPNAYSMHSFGRGGTQHFSSIEGWTIRKLCDGGGWLLNFDNLTIVRYLSGVKDDPVNPRESFLMPSASASS
ncbi:hypothetical protein BKA64DRAFT_585705, partial [Cadophora sp. MPI-SDFR-AT-0126]